MRLAGLARFELGVWPTPLQEAPHLSEALETPVWIKRDDLTGVGLGGNKVRKLEYLIADALDQAADTLVTGGGPQSNHAVLTALAGARTGFSTHLVFYGKEPSEESRGNAVLADLAGVQITWTGDSDRSSVDRGIEKIASELRDKGQRPYTIPRGGATALGCVGYVRASLELAQQLLDHELSPSHVVVATGSCGTQAGLALGAHWLQASYRVIGLTVSRPRSECLERISRLGASCAELLELEVGDLDLEVSDDYIGPGYGQPTPEGRAAMELVARTEGLVLDPVFTAKAMAALIDLAPGLEGPVVFWHTGGAPTTFGPAMSSGGSM